MPKTISLVITRCGDCPYKKYDVLASPEGYYCHKTDSWINNLLGINEDCPLKDVEETQ